MQRSWCSAEATGGGSGSYAGGAGEASGEPPRAPSLQKAVDSGTLVRVRGRGYEAKRLEAKRLSDINAILRRPDAGGPAPESTLDYVGASGPACAALDAIHSKPFAFRTVWAAGEERNVTSALAASV